MSDVLAKPVSFSRLSTWFECHHKWWLRYRADVPEVPMWAGVGGTAFHAATEKIDREESWRDLPQEQ